MRICAYLKTLMLILWRKLFDSIFLSNPNTSKLSLSVLGLICTVYRVLRSSIWPKMSRIVADSANSNSMLLSPELLIVLGTDITTRMK